MTSKARSTGAALAICACGAVPAVALAQSSANAPGNQYTPTAPVTVTATATTTTPAPPTPLPGGGTAPTTTGGGSNEPDDRGTDPEPSSGTGPADGAGTGSEPANDSGSNPLGASAPAGANGGGGGAPGSAGGAPGFCSSEVALTATGGENEGLLTAVEDVTGDPAYSARLRLPVALRSLAQDLGASLPAGDLAAMRAAGLRLGQATSPADALFSRSAGDLFAANTLEGKLAPVGGIVLMATVPPGDLTEAEKKSRTALIAGLVRGMQRRSAACLAPRLVAVEQTTTKPTQLGQFMRLGVTTIDNVDEPTGKATLRAVLAGQAEGDFGTKPAADAVLPTGDDGKPIKVSPAASTFAPADSPLDGGSPLAGLLLVGVVAAGALALGGGRMRRRSWR